MIDLSPFADTLNNKPLAVYGLGVSGLASLQAFIDTGIKCIAWDENQQTREKAKSIGARVEPLTQDILTGCAALILSPGVPLTHPAPHDVVVAANAAGLEIIGDLEALHRAQHEYKTIGITGTNGKSTTTALLTHVLNACGCDAIMAGNIGVPALAISPPTKETIIVLEMSSYQIDLCPSFRPDIAVLLNITPDHIDRHGSFENYAAIKRRLLLGAGKSIDLSDAFNVPPSLGEHEFPSLAGAHNVQNMTAVLSVCDAIGIDENAAIKALKTFPGLPHRQYVVREIRGVKYINDSKATNAEASAKALSSFDNIHWIIGGQAKDGGLNGLEGFADKIEHAYVIGEAMESFSEWLTAKNIPFTKSKTLESATQSAHDGAQMSGAAATVLLSPACASWDQFKSFEHRGDVFASKVEALP